MKRYLIILIPFLFAMCNGISKKEAALMNESDSLQRVIVNKDSALYAFLETYNSVEMNLQAIKEKENIITLTAASSENKLSREEKINNDINQIYEMMLKNREKVAQLEQRLKNSQFQNKELQKAIENMRMQIVAKDSEIIELHQQLRDLNIVVNTMAYKIDTLEILNHEKDNLIKQQDDDINTIYYLIGNEQELTAAKILDKKGLFSSKKLNNDFDKSLFTKADLRELKKIDINAKKIKIITSHTSSAYTLIGEKPVESIEITDPKQFWEVSKYLIIVVYQ